MDFHDSSVLPGVLPTAYCPGEVLHNASVIRITTGRLGGEEIRGYRRSGEIEGTKSFQSLDLENVLLSMVASVVELPHQERGATGGVHQE